MSLRCRRDSVPRVSRGILTAREKVSGRLASSEIHGLNVYGCRGRDFAIDPSPGQRRLLLIGDSVTEGIGAKVLPTMVKS